MKPDDEIDVSDLVESRPRATEQLDSFAARPRAVRRVRLSALEGPASGSSWQSSGDRLTIGSHPSNDVVLEDAAVSGFHCEIQVEKTGAWLKDLGSKNGTLLDGVPIREAGLRDASLLRVGRSVIRFQLGSEQNQLPVSDRTEFGTLVGISVAMRSTFSLLERAAASDATVLVTGETGTGKEGAAESIHRASSRGDAPFLVVDCGAIPTNLLESELFGHERGAFTGATSRRVGVFEEAEGGTVFLDEVGELPAELQPRLLRVLEQREIRRVGSNAFQKVDVRMVAATNRDLRARVNEGAFRSDLYFRLAVVEVELPALRHRPEDIPVLVSRFLDLLGVDAETERRLLDPDFVAQLQRAAWPGNVRELRNHVERCVVMQHTVPISEPDAEDAGFMVDSTLSYSEAKRRILDEFERRYLESLLARHQGNVSRAARAAGMDRVYVYKLLHRHGLK